MMDDTMRFVDEARPWRFVPVNFELVLDTTLNPDARWLYTCLVGLSAQKRVRALRASKERWMEVTGLGWRRFAAARQSLEDAGVVRLERPPGEPVTMVLQSTERYIPVQHEKETPEPRGDQRMFEILCQMKLVSPRVVTAQQRGMFNKKLKSWRDAGFNVAHMETALSLWHEDWRYKKDHTNAPSYTVIEELLARAASGVTPAAETEKDAVSAELDWLNG